MTDEQLMERALALARRGSPSPNPFVGAVIARDGRILSEGFHAERGGSHAEAAALTGCGESVEGAVLAVTLEPCCHSGGGKLTPPCTDAIIGAGISRVVVGSLDPNPRVSGRGVQTLRDAGLDVQTGVLREECDSLNRFYFHHRETGRPYVLLKTAQTLDGFAALKEGGGRITGAEAEKAVHSLRRDYQAVMIGGGTLRRDKPRLNVRLVPGRDPLKIVLSASLDLPLDSHLFRNPEEVWVITTADSDPKKKALLEERGITVIQVSFPISHEEVFLELGNRGVISVLVEAGPRLADQLLSWINLDEWHLHLAPRLWGSGYSSWPTPRNPISKSLKLKETFTAGDDAVLCFRKERRVLCSQG